MRVSVAKVDGEEFEEALRGPLPCAGLAKAATAPATSAGSPTQPVFSD